MPGQFERTYTEPPANDAEGKALEAFANGEPYVFIVAELDGEGINLRVASQHGEDTIKAILHRTLEALA